MLRSFYFISFHSEIIARIRMGVALAEDEWTCIIGQHLSALHLGSDVGTANDREECSALFLYFFRCALWVEIPRVIIHPPPS